MQPAVIPIYGNGMFLNREGHAVPTGRFLVFGHGFASVGAAIVEKLKRLVPLLGIQSTGEFASVGQQDSNERIGRITRVV